MPFSEVGKSGGTAGFGGKENQEFSFERWNVKCLWEWNETEMKTVVFLRLGEKTCYSYNCYEIWLSTPYYKSTVIYLAEGDCGMLLKKRGYTKFVKGKKGLTVGQRKKGTPCRKKKCVLRPETREHPKNQHRRIVQNELNRVICQVKTSEFNPKSKKNIRRR